MGEAPEAGPGLERLVNLSGTAYVIEEQAPFWREEDKRRVLAAITSGFRDVLVVPGPGELGENWRWQADADGAPQWDARAWPHRVYPVHYTGRCLVVPDLDLGRGSVRAERA